jgi:hypothetical protein
MSDYPCLEGGENGWMGFLVFYECICIFVICRCCEEAHAIRLRFKDSCEALKGCS